MEKKKLFDHYYNLMSNEWRREILNYEDFKMQNVECAIKVNFVNGSWIRVYEKMNGEVEWY